MKRYNKQPILYGFSLFIILVLFFYGTNTSILTNGYAQPGTDLQVKITYACEFADDVNASSLVDCEPINDGELITFNNVLFYVKSNTPVKQFLCNLQREGQPIPIPDNADNSCQKGSITAQKVYKNLEAGDYEFFVTAIRNVLNQSGNSEEEESKNSAIFHFTILGSTTGAGGLNIETLQEHGGNTTSKFFDMISKGKTTFLNVVDIKPHTIIKPNGIACFEIEEIGDFPSSGKYSIQELDCNYTIVFEKNETYVKDSIRSQYPVNSSIIPTALQEGIDRPITACAIYASEKEEGGWAYLQGVKCENLFIAYK